MRLLFGCLMTLATCVFGSPFIISQGGWYSGTWSNTDPYNTAVLITTTQPVIIANSVISSRGDGIDSGVSKTNVTVYDTYFVMQNPLVAGKTKGTCLNISDPAYLAVFWNQAESPFGFVDVWGNNQAITTSTIAIWGNRIRNIDGRPSAGASGEYLLSTKMNGDICVNGYAHVITLAFVHGDPNMTISWNEIINTPGQSAPSDQIDIYNSSGTQTSPLRIIDNYIQGVFPDDVNAVQLYAGGVVLDGDGTADPLLCTSFVQVHDNQFVGTEGGAVTMWRGYSEEAFNNRVVAAGLQPDGQFYHFPNCGLQIFNGNPNTNWYLSFSIHDNVVGFMDPQTGRRSRSLSAGSDDSR